MCRSPNGECVDGIEDICLGEVEDDVSVKVPDLQDALLVAPEDFVCDFDAMSMLAFATQQGQRHVLCI